MDKELIGIFVKYHRKRLKLSQTDIAKKLKRRRQAIYELEQNKCDTGFEFVEEVLNCLGYELMPIEKGRVSPSE